MTASVNAVAGTKLYIGDTNTVPSPDNYIEIGDISNLGDISQQFAPVTVESVGSGYSFALKGTEQFPNFELILNRNDSDTGQIALKAASALARGTLTNFKIVETDGGIITWAGEVFGFGPSYGGVNSLRQVKTSISIRPASFSQTLG